MQLCALHKNGGVAIARDTILACARLAAVKVEEIHKVLDNALAGADKQATLDRQVKLFCFCCCCVVYVARWTAAVVTEGGG